MSTQRDEEEQILPWIQRLGDELLEAKHKREGTGDPSTQQESSTESNLSHVFEQRLRRAKQQADHRALSGHSEHTPVQRPETQTQDNTQPSPPDENALPWLDFLEQQLRDAKNKARR